MGHGLVRYHEIRCEIWIVKYEFKAKGVEVVILWYCNLGWYGAVKYCIMTSF